jgi:hypothetical protein
MTTPRQPRGDRDADGALSGADQLCASWSRSRFSSASGSGAYTLTISMPLQRDAVCAPSGWLRVMVHAG